MSHAKNKSTTA